jgi:predicted HTH transcriptional regulator
MNIDCLSLDYSALVALVESRRSEDQGIEFKEVLRPQAPDQRSQYLYQLRRAAASFANTAGGCFLFGVADQQDSLSGEARLVGLKPQGDHLKELADVLGPEIDPPLDYIPGNPPVLCPSGNIVLVVRVPRSPRRPHAVKRPGGTLTEFWKREAGRIGGMCRQEIEEQFGQYELRRSKARLFVLELAYISR